MYVNKISNYNFKWRKYLRTYLLLLSLSAQSTHTLLVNHYK
jgi:hypothetical protein